MHWNETVCVITGASSGFGEAAARAIAARGGTIIALARRESKLKDLVDQLGGAPHSYIVCDVSDLAQIREAVTAVGSRTSHVDVLINNAGIRSSGPLAEATSEEMERVIRTNLLGSMWCTKEFLPLLEKAPRSPRTPVVVNIASIAGRIPAPRAADYTASKFGLVGFTEAALPDLTERGVRAMVVNPGLADTEGFPMDKMRSNPLTAWSVMDAERVVRALIHGIERGSFEVRVQWWTSPLYLVSVAAGPARRAIANALKDKVGG